MNLGSPDAPEPPALKRYLRQFLSDPRVLEIPALLRKALLELIILPRRSKTSAELYRSVWTKVGSPLIAICRTQARLIGEELGSAYHVELAMRYGNPSIEAAVARLEEAGCRQIAVLTGFPQYSNTTVGSVYAELFRVIADRRDMPAVSVVPPYPDDPRYLDVLAESIRPHLERFRPDHLVLSFHGIPVRYATNGDPYPEECARTAQGVARRLGLEDGTWTQTFQSRFGREPWLEPYTDETLEKLAGSAPKVLVACPGFTADCLETIEEIGQENRELFEKAGGERLRLVPCLNSRRDFARCLADLVRRAAPAPVR